MRQNGTLKRECRSRSFMPKYKFADGKSRKQISFGVKPRKFMDYRSTIHEEEESEIFNRSKQLKELIEGTRKK
jgi:hypothetical protein